MLDGWWRVHVQYTVPHLVVVVESKPLATLAQLLELDGLGIADERWHPLKRSALASSATDRDACVCSWLTASKRRLSASLGVIGLVGTPRT